jgi:hypothetical protein
MGTVPLSQTFFRYARTTSALFGSAIHARKARGSAHRNAARKVSPIRPNSRPPGPNSDKAATPRPTELAAVDRCSRSNQNRRDNRNQPHPLTRAAASAARGGRPEPITPLAERYHQRPRVPASLKRPRGNNAGRESYAAPNPCSGHDVMFAAADCFQLAGGRVL